MIKEAIIKLAKKENLSSDEMKVVFNEIFDKQATAAQVAAFLTVLSLKEENADEISAAANIVRQRASKVNVRAEFLGKECSDEIIFDSCGTGGSGTNKFNISTATAFVVSSAGIKVAKHGNRAMSSNCGSADVLEKLGIKIDVTPKVMETAIKEIGIGFLFAPLYHPALKDVAQIRKEIGIKTIFNILGPLCSPANATHQLMGVCRESLVLTIAQVFKQLGTKKAFVFCSKDLKDEISLSSETKVAFLNNKKIEKFVLRPSTFGLKRIKERDLVVKDAQMSAQIMLSIFSGIKSPARDMVLASSSASFYMLGKVKDFKAGVKLAAELIDNGKVNQKFLQLKEFVMGK